MVWKIIAGFFIVSALLCLYKFFTKDKLWGFCGFCGFLFTALGLISLIHQGWIK